MSIHFHVYADGYERSGLVSLNAVRDYVRELEAQRGRVAFVRVCKVVNLMVTETVVARDDRGRGHAV